MVVLLLPAGCKQEQAPAPAAEKTGADNLAYRWAKVGLEATALESNRRKARPTVTSRTLALVMHSMYDAWAMYDEKALPVYLDPSLRRPEAERTLENKEKAISYAAYRALQNVYPIDSALFTTRMQEFGFNPNDTSTDPSTPQGIGNLAAQAMIEARKDDGANQYGDMPGCSGDPYSDYTGYKPVNEPGMIKDQDAWTPIPFSDGKGGTVTFDCLSPHWYKVRPFALDSAGMFRPGPPPLVGSEQMEKEVAEVLEMNANLTNEQKALVEFMRDGPHSVQQAGHWLIFAQAVSRRDKHTLDEDIKMNFLVVSAAMDAFIASWDAKMYYNSSRPHALVRHYYKGKDIQAWGGPNKGTVTIKGEDWMPYSPETFITPCFPSYVSGHSTVSAACAEILKRFTGDDYYGEKVKLLPGSMTEPGLTQDSIVLELKTFTETAEMAGISRILGGYHIQADNIEGLNLGRKVAGAVWDKGMALINPPPAPKGEN